MREKNPENTVVVPISFVCNNWKVTVRAKIKDVVHSSNDSECNDIKNLTYVWILHGTVAL